ncbi:hypothetical protein ABZ172_02465 [Streptomyces sp. NPDC006296]|uniref:hypothetical protein n=1 Tax=Streptomyces sp. NPDC006296 TaxID=3156746 RepID=UPI0033B59A64
MLYHDERPHGFEDRLRRDASASADVPGKPPSRTFRPGPTTWLWLAVGVVGLLAGIFIGHGLLIAAGLVVAGMAAQLLDPQRRGRRGGVPGTR